MLKILIADDHAVVRRGIKQLLAEELRNATFAEAADAQETLESVRKQDWDLLILDVSMPGGSGLDVLKEIKVSRPELRVLVLSVHPEDQYAMRILKAGAVGYMTKEAPPMELVKAVRKVLAGGPYVSPSLAEKLATNLAADTGELPHEKLSNREFEVLRMIASGKTVTQIAKELSLSVKTVSTYRARVLEKMGMKTGAELTHYAIFNRLVE
jgi:two-component system, NarL family, invasion response regulator UvrY